MKKIISAVLIAAVFSTSSFAYNTNEKPGSPVNKEIAINADFQRIKVGRNLQLVLVQDVNRSTIVVTGDEKSVQSINVNIDKGLLSITSKNNITWKRTKIYVPVTTLTSVELDDDASVAAEGIIMLDDLKVLVHDGSKVMLHVLGNFEVEPAEGCDVEYAKYETSKVIFVKR